MMAVTVLSILCVGLSAGALAVGLLALQALRREQARVESLQASVAALSREVELVASISARTGRRVQRVEHDYSEVADRVDVVESRAPAATGAGGLDQAIEWVRRGGDVEKLTEQFNLSAGEAELVVRLHGRKRSA